MAANDLSVNSVAVARTAIAGGTAPQKQLKIDVEIENKAGARRFAWSSLRHYEYDKTTKVLSLHLAEHAPALPPGMILISDHPRTPDQIELAPGAKATVQVEIPAFIRRASPDGKGWIEDPIGTVDHVELRLQHAPTAVEAVKPHESGEQFRARAIKGSSVAITRIPIRAQNSTGTKDNRN